MASLAGFARAGCHPFALNCSEAALVATSGARPALLPHCHLRGTTNGSAVCRCRRTAWLGSCWTPTAASTFWSTWRAHVSQPGGGRWPSSRLQPCHHPNSASRPASLRRHPRAPASTHPHHARPVCRADPSVPADPDPGAVDQLEGDPDSWDAAFRCSCGAAWRGMACTAAQAVGWKGPKLCNTFTPPALPLCACSLNVLAPMRLTRLLAPAMAEKGGPGQTGSSARFCCGLRGALLAPPACALPNTAHPAPQPLPRTCCLLRPAHSLLLLPALLRLRPCPAAPTLSAGAAPLLCRARPHHQLGVRGCSQRGGRVSCSRL